jgi:predicted nucleic acid-binding protein
MPLVIDASLAYRLIVPSRDREKLRSLMDQWLHAQHPFAAPSLWLYELTSALVKSAHFGELSEDDAHRALQSMQAFPIELVMPSPVLTEAAFAWSLRLQRTNAYDAFYLALAEALGCELWTADRRLVNAVGQEWVKNPLD